jgi:hypothetical protein
VDTCGAGGSVLWTGNVASCARAGMTPLRIACAIDRDPAGTTLTRDSPSGALARTWTTTGFAAAASLSRPGDAAISV